MVTAVSHCMAVAVPASCSHRSCGAPLMSLTPAPWRPAGTAVRRVNGRLSQQINIRTGNGLRHLVRDVLPTS